MPRSWTGVFAGRGVQLRLSPVSGVTVTQWLSKHSLLESLAALVGSTHRSLSCLSHGLRAQHARKTWRKECLLNVGTHMRLYFSPLFPYFSGLVLRTTFSNHVIYSGSFNLQACASSGNLWRLKDIPTKYQKVVTAGGVGVAKQGCNAKSRTSAREPHESIPTSTRLWTHTRSFCPSRSAPGRGRKPMQESRTAAAYSGIDLALLRS